MEPDLNAVKFLTASFKLEMQVVTFMLQCPPVLKSFRASQQMEAETCTAATHAGISTSHVRRGADSKNYYAVIIAPTFISNQDKTVYSIVQASFFVHINQTCFRWIVAC